MLAYYSMLPEDPL